MAAKLLFTAAPVTQAPYLEGTLEWDANIDVLLTSDPRCIFSSGRRIQKVRLLQMDLAVRDKRADDTTGWIFATYAYDGSRGGAGWWERMVAVGIMWGNDPKLDQAAFNAGTRVTESWINPDLRTPQHLGFLGRLNGPVDNPKSSCLSCHMTAQTPVRSPMMPPNDSGFPMRWFENMPAGNSFDQRSIGTDYNLQISSGIQSFQLWKQTLRDGYVAHRSSRPPPPASAAMASPGRAVTSDGWRRAADCPRTASTPGGALGVRTGRSRATNVPDRAAFCRPPELLRMDWTWYLFRFDGRIDRAKLWLARTGPAGLDDGVGAGDRGHPRPVRQRHVLPFRRLGSLQAGGSRRVPVPDMGRSPPAPDQAVRHLADHVGLLRDLDQATA